VQDTRALKHKHIIRTLHVCETNDVPARSQRTRSRPATEQTLTRTEDSWLQGIQCASQKHSALHNHHHHHHQLLSRQIKKTHTAHYHAVALAALSAMRWSAQCGLWEKSTTVRGHKQALPNSPRSRKKNSQQKNHVNQHVGTEMCLVWELSRWHRCGAVCPI
jgi:hypothetical protein